MTYGPWVTMAERAMDRTTFGIQWTAGQTTAIGALCVIAMSPVFAWLWPRLDKAGMNPGYPAKFAWALVLCGASFGEMVLSPIGLAAVTALSIPRVVSTMMGAWFLFSAFGEKIAGRLATFAAVTPAADGGISAAQALSVYGPFFTQMMWIGLAAGALMFVATPFLNRLTR